MPQELHVLKCFACDQFQTHIVKKTNKWVCKICGVKQSVKKEYGRGSGKDCRLHTQKLNILRGIKEEHSSAKEEAMSSNLTQESLEQQSPMKRKENGVLKSIKWDYYIERSKTEQEGSSYTKEELHQSSDFKINHSNNRTKTFSKIKNTKPIKRDDIKIHDQFCDNPQDDSNDFITDTSHFGDTSLCANSNYKPTVSVSFDACDDTEFIKSPTKKKIKLNSVKTGLKWEKYMTQELLSTPDIVNPQTNEDEYVYFEESSPNDSERKNILEAESHKNSVTEKVANLINNNSNKEHKYLAHSVLDVPVFEQSYDPDDIDIQLDF